MSAPLLGLESILTDEACERVELRRADGAAVLTFLRQAEDEWVRDDQESDPLHTKELREIIRREFGRASGRLVCFLPSETVAYVSERGSVRIERTPLTPQRTGDDDMGRAELDVVADALGIPKSKRKAKFKQAYHFGRIVEEALAGTKGKDLRILDLACGRSYLGFVLVQLLRARGCTTRLHGVDSDQALVDKSREIAEALQWKNCSFEVADLADYVGTPDAYDILVSLHGCDTLTDEAIRIGCEGRTPLLFVVPCCQHELRHLWKEHPLQWVSRYGLLEQRLADVLTDAFRCVVLEALGYQVKVLRFADPEITPKNLLIQARLTTPPRPERARDAEAFMNQFAVRPKLAQLLKSLR